MIEFYCSECGKNLKVGKEAAGKRGRCLECGATLLVPEAEIVTLEVAEVRSPQPQPPIIAPPPREVAAQDPPVNPRLKSLMTVKQVADMLNVSVRTVAARTESGELGSIKLGRLRRYRLEDVQDFINRGRTTMPNT